MDLQRRRIENENSVKCVYKLTWDIHEWSTGLWSLNRVLSAWETMAVPIIMAMVALGRFQIQ